MPVRLPGSRPASPRRRLLGHCEIPIIIRGGGQRRSPRRACDTKVERREKLKEGSKILAYPYLQAARSATPGEGAALPGCRLSRAPRFCPLRPLRKTSVWLVFICVHRRPISGLSFVFGRRKSKSLKA